MKLIHTEEDIKQKVIMPFLLSLGFDNSELKFEDSFTIRLGKHCVSINTQKQVETACPRLDILVKHKGINLFVIEVKSDAIILTDQDRDQAVCYARLVDPIAPFAILTNGKEFLIYETITKNRIDESFDFRGYKLSVNIADIYEEAFEHFVGYSEENLKMYCNAQVLDGMKTLLGSREERSKKFIPDLYVGRDNLLHAIAKFIESDKAVFAIYGESGIGKTCEMCGLALHFINILPVLFYRGINITTNFTNHLAADFNWEFSSSYDDVALLKKVSRILTKPLLIFLDGVDEWMSPCKVEELGNFAAKLIGRNIKLIISCKTSNWLNFITKLGTPTQLSEELYVLKPEEDEKGYLLTYQCDKDFFKTLNRYRSVYSFNGAFEDIVLQECKRSPFLLRVFFEVAEQTSCKHLSFSLREFYKCYYETILSHIPYDEREQAKYQIKILAELLLNSNSDLVEVDRFRQTLGLKTNESICKYLIERNIIELTSDEFENYVGFYFHKFRDYIISFYVKKWQKMSVAELKEDYKANVFNNNLWLEAFKLFYTLATDDKQCVVDEMLRTNANAYLDLYISTLDTYFPPFKAKFAPYTCSDIGFIAEYNMRSQVLWMYGFRCLKPDMPRIKFIPADNIRGAGASNVPELMGATRMHYTSSSNGFVNFDIIKEVIDKEIIDQILELVRKCNLYEGHNYYLSLERTLVCLKALHLFSGKDLRDFFPISFSEVQDRLQYKHAYKYFENELIEDKRASGEIKETWSGSTVSYHINFSDNDREWIESKASTAVAQGQIFNNRLDVDSNHCEALLNESIEAIKKHKPNINETILPINDNINRTGYYCDDYKPNTLFKCIKTLYKVFLDEYACLVRTNFNFFKEHFNLFSHMPIKLFIKISTNADSDIMYSMNLYWCTKAGNEGPENEVVLVDDESFKAGSGRFCFVYNGVEYKAFLLSGPSVRSFFSPSGAVSTRFGASSGPDTILRNLVYSQILNELPPFFDALREKYGCL